MKKLVLPFSAIVLAVAASPAIAGSVVDIVEISPTASAVRLQAKSIPFGSHSPVRIANDQPRNSETAKFNSNETKYRLPALNLHRYDEANGGVARLFVPEEFAFSSTEQDTGYYAVMPGHHISSSVRADYLNHGKGMTNDKLTSGIKLSF